MYCICYKSIFVILKKLNPIVKCFKVLLTIAVLLITTISTAQVKKPFTLRYQSSINGDVIVVGNNTISRTATGNYNGSDGNHDFSDNVYVDIDNDLTTFNSSSANLTNPYPGDPCLAIDKVLLYWAAADKGLIVGNGNNAVELDNQPGWNYNQVKIMLPGQTSYTTVSADDVIFSFQRILNPEHDFHYVSGGHYPYFEQIKFNKLVSSVEKINQYTVRFNLHVPDASFLAHLATPYAVILSSEYGSILTEKNMRSYIDTHPIGTGPFKLQEFRAGSLIRFYQHKDYWRKSMPFEQLVYDITTSNTGRLTKLMTGECDIISDPIGHNKITERKDLTLESVTSLDVAYLALNTLKTPLNEPLVRQAINLAINKEAIINATYLGHAVVADSLLPPTSWAFQTTYNNKEYNPEKAKALLAQAGFEQGFEMDLWAPPETTSYNPNSLTMAILIQEDLRSIGITVNIIHDHPPVIIGMSEPANYDSMLSGWSANHPDPDNFFSYLLSCDATLTGSNRAFWCHQTFDNLLEKGLHTAQIEQRKYHYQQALNLLATEMPIIPIAHSKTYKAKNNKISGNFFNNFGVNFINVSKK